MTTTKVAVVAAAFLLGLSCGAVAILFPATFGSWGVHNVPPPHPVWREVAWPFPIDQWGRGKAFRCAPADCGTEVNVYVRAKLGFCNCTTGVADDEELDRISDYALLGKSWTPLTRGKPIKIAWMAGRSRAFLLARGQSGISIGFNDHCDAIIATAALGHDRPDLVEESVLAFLNSETVLHWAEATLGL